MLISELLLIAVGLSMDAFAVSVSNGLALRCLRLRDALKFGLFFGFFQMLMPLLGWAVGRLFSDYVMAFDHWVAFVLLGYIGTKMVMDGLRGSDSACGDTGFKTMLILAIATSIDALAAGVTFAFMNINIWFSISVIGAITFFLSAFGVLIGKRVGDKLGGKAQLLGGFLLIAMGVKILIEHLFF
ncbi:MAG: manganese efflux pump [Ruminococcaceae bacterium]|nr:manganese efflux pump [Oscillospiraceae bacterium]